MGQGDVESFTFDDDEVTPPGTYTYHCTIHPGMTGRVTVQVLP
jgi:plastocyanin